MLEVNYLEWLLRPVNSLRRQYKAQMVIEVWISRQRVPGLGGSLFKILILRETKRTLNI